MTDLPAMSRCKVRKSGRHDLSYIIPSEDDKDLTAICDACGAMRRVPVNGQLLASRLDDLTAAEIDGLVGNRANQT